MSQAENLFCLGVSGYAWAFLRDSRLAHLVCLGLPRYSEIKSQLLYH